jgi:DUF4097 and DUF4098 domain-containing protein YvlB
MKLLLALALLVPTAAFADIGCKIEQAEELALDLNGVTTLVVEMGADTLHLDGAADADGVVRGRACASSDKRLALLSLKQQRQGDRLTLQLVRERGASVVVIFGSDYAYHDVNLHVPPSLAVELHMGSGDAFINGVAALDASLGSGDLEAKDIAGSFTVDVGSGDVKADAVGALHVTSVGSGDIIVNGVASNTAIDTVGSGDVTVRNVDGAVTVGAIGSGDVELHTVAGDVSVERIGSGDLRADGVGGNVVVEHIGSGDVHAQRVKGEVVVPRT